MAAPYAMESLTTLRGAKIDDAMTVELRGDGRTLILSGALGDGAAQTLETMLGKHASVRHLVLDSHGGYVAQGEAMAELVRRHDLTTVVEHECASACTMVFLAATDRWLVGKGKLGFHRSSWMDLPGTASRDDDVKDYRILGYDNELIDRLMVPHWSISSPAAAELLAAGLVTAVLREEEYESLFEVPVCSSVKLHRKVSPGTQDGRRAKGKRNEPDNV